MSVHQGWDAETTWHWADAAVRGSTSLWAGQYLPSTGIQPDQVSGW